MCGEGIIAIDWDFRVCDRGFLPDTCHSPPDTAFAAIWQYGATTVPGAGGNVWGTNLSANPPGGGGEGLLSPSFTVTPFTRILGLSHNYDIEPMGGRFYHAGGNVKVRFNGTDTLIHPMTPYGGFAEYAPCVYFQDSWEDISAPWQVDCFDLQAFMGKKIQLEFDVGWFVDNPPAVWDISRVTLGSMNPAQVSGPPGTVPSFSLLQNEPNPGATPTRIRFAVAGQGRVRLRVFDAFGRAVATLVDGVLSSGPHEISWNGLNGAGVPVGSGMYFYRLEAGGLMQVRKMLILR